MLIRNYITEYCITNYSFASHDTSYMLNVVSSIKGSISLFAGAPNIGRRSLKTRLLNEWRQKFDEVLACKDAIFDDRYVCYLGKSDHTLPYQSSVTSLDLCLYYILRHYHDSQEPGRRG